MTHSVVRSRGATASGPTGDAPTESGLAAARSRYIPGLGQRLEQGAGLLGMVLLLALPAGLRAQFTYTTNNGALTLTGYTGPGGAVVIPSVIQGLPVTGIGNWAFFPNCTNVTSVTVGLNVTRIGAGAFVYCYGLTNILLPNRLTRIGDGAFQWCTSLTSITIPRSVTSIGNAAFYGCKSLTDITVDPQNATYSSATGVLFNTSRSRLIECPGGLSGSYTIPGSVTSIGNHAFDSCVSLTSVTIPSGVTNIGNWAFAGCTRLRGAYFQGDAPGDDPTMFQGAPKVTLYYRPGTKGWSSPFAGVPAALWNPPTPAGSLQVHVTPAGPSSLGRLAGSISTSD